MRKLIKNTTLIIFIFLAVSLLFAVFSGNSNKAKDLTITQLVQDVNQEKIKRIVVNGENVDVVYKNGEKAKTFKEAGVGLYELLSDWGAEENKLKQIEVKIDTENKSNWLMIVSVFFYSVLPLLILIGLFFFFFRQMKAGASQAFNFTKSRARIFGIGQQEKEKVTFDDVAGAKEAKEELVEIVDFLKNPKKYIQMGARIPKGVLLMGPPGTGKTLLARAVASEAGVPFFSISGSEFIEMFVGVGSARVRDLFSMAKKHQPSIIFIDELDAIGRMRGTGIGGGHDEREQTLNQILVEMDGFEKNATTLVFAATNRPDVLDPALLRPGRFDRRVVLDLPDVNDRREILKIHCKDKPLTSDVDFQEIAERTPGFSGADLANLANEAALLAARRGKRQISQIEFLESIEKVLLGPERKSHVLSKKEKEITAYHEAGHALVSSFLPGAEPVRKISIIARGMAAGYTLKVPSEERKLKTKNEFLSEMATLLGGYCAEKIKFGDVTTGASNDLKKVSDLARSLVKEYGMSSLGPIAFGEKEELVFLGKEITEERNYSEKVAAEIDKEVEKFIKWAEKKATEVLTKNKKLLDKIANILIEKETIEKEEFEAILKDFKKERSRKKKDNLKKGRDKQDIKMQIRKV